MSQELAALEEITGETIAFRRRVRVVKVRAHFRPSKAAELGIRRKVIVISDQNRLAVSKDI